MIISIILSLILIAVCWKSIWKAIRISLVVTGYACLAIAGSPLPDVEEKRRMVEEKPREVQSTEEPDDPLNRYGKKWQLNGLTPLDFMAGCKAEQNRSIQDFADVQWLQEKEPLENYLRRKRLERV